MTSGMEPTRQTGLDLVHTAFQFIKLATVVAVEVVMMLLARNLVTRRFTWNLNRGQPAILDQRFDVSINGSNSQTLVVLLRGRQSFFQRERSISLGKCFADSVFLSCVTDIHQGIE